MASVTDEMMQQLQDERTRADNHERLLRRIVDSIDEVIFSPDVKPSIETATRVCREIKQAAEAELV